MRNELSTMVDGSFCFINFRLDLLLYYALDWKILLTVCQVVRNSTGSVTSLLGPWGEPYDDAA